MPSSRTILIHKQDGHGGASSNDRQGLEYDKPDDTSSPSHQKEGLFVYWVHPNINEVLFNSGAGLKYPEPLETEEELLEAYYEWCDKEWPGDD